ncbi:MAG: tRNA lysidine(34) synthetase TilS, partial [bacterium]
MKKEEDLTARVEKNIIEDHLLTAGDKVVVGISGGIDSTALLLVLHRLSKRYRWKLIAAHFNHGLRGMEADRDEKFCHLLAQRLGLKFESERLGEGVLEGMRGASIEDAARRERHAFLEKIRRKHKAQRVALGHNRDDQVETVLFRLMRGTSLRGLSGMDFKNGCIIRPLLNIPRTEILNFCRINKIHYREDST